MIAQKFILLKKNMFIVLSRPDVNKCKNHGKKNNVRVLVHKKENNNMYISINQRGC